MYDLQSRWKLEGKILRYYGLRNGPELFRNTVRLRPAQRQILERLPCDLTQAQCRTLGNLMGHQVVPSEQKRPVPRSLSVAKFCKECAANDFIIPGLEFDGQGRCPLCQTKEATAHLRSVVPVLNTFPRAKRSRFDVALFYTGGKDSTYLLHYLSKVLGLRVLALTWEIPYMSDLFPALRSRLGVVLERTGACNGCGICGKHCPVGTMGDGIPGSNCIRCLRCAALCPRQALRFRLRWPMRCYLRKANRVQAECFLPTKTP